MAAGDRPVRIVAALSVSAWIGSAAVQVPGQGAHTQWGIFGIDVLLFAAVLYLALTTDRWWMLAYAAYQLLGVANHVANIADMGLHKSAYITASYVWSYGTLIALVGGAASHQRRRSRAETTRQDSSRGLIADV